MAAYGTLRVRNFLGIKKADVILDKIVLVAGVNGAGKSSLIEALASVALETPLARGMRSKSAAAKLLHNGAEAGSINLDWSGGGRRIVYPQAEIEVAGRPVQIGTSLGIGSARLMALRPEDRMSQMTSRFKLEPALSDLREWFADKPEAGMQTIKETDDTEIDPVAVLWARIELSGWDAVHAACKEHSQKMKGGWQATTNASWGSRLARNWCPPELLPGEVYDLDKVRLSIAEAKQEVETLVSQQAVSKRDKDELEMLAAGEAAAEATIADLTERHNALSAQIEELMTWIAANPVPADTTLLPVCPHCTKPLLVSMSGIGSRAKPVLQAVDGEPKTKAQIKAALTAMEEKDGELATAKRELTDTIGALGNARGALQRATNAAAELDTWKEDSGHGVEMPAALERARTLVSDLERKASAIENHAKAKGYYEEWVRNQMVVDALDADGVRRKALSNKLGTLNTALAEYSAKARWSPVEMTADMDATYDGRPYALLSESEKWRVDLTLTALINRQEKAHLILVDRVDILAPKSRPGVFYLLRTLGIPALVAMTASSLKAPLKPDGSKSDRPDPVPDIDTAGLGKRMWLENGSIVET